MFNGPLLRLTKLRCLIRRPGGFTLIELVMVTVVVALLGAMAVPKWVAASQRYQLDLAARRVSSDLLAARTRAAFASASVTVTFNVQQNTYQAVGMPDPDHNVPTYTVSLGSPPYHAQITGATFGGASAVTFDGYGMPSSGGTVTITSGASSRTLTLDGTAGTVNTQ